MFQVQACGGQDEQPSLKCQDWYVITKMCHSLQRSIVTELLSSYWLAHCFLLLRWIHFFRLVYLRLFKDTSLSGSMIFSPHRIVLWKRVCHRWSRYDLLDWVVYMYFVNFSANAKSSPPDSLQGGVWKL